jgi:hypothetical protein
MRPTAARSRRPRSPDIRGAWRIPHHAGGGCRHEDVLWLDTLKCSTEIVDVALDQCIATPGYWAGADESTQQKGIQPAALAIEAGIESLQTEQRCLERLDSLRATVEAS